MGDTIKLSAKYRYEAEKISQVRYSSVVQSAERKTVNLDVGGSNPSRGASYAQRCGWGKKIAIGVVGIDLKVKLPPTDATKEERRLVCGMSG